MRPLRELKHGAWYEIHTAVNNRKPLFQSRKALRLFAKVLDDTAARFDFEIRSLRLKDDLLVFRVKPADGFQLPRIMQWLKQTFAVRYNLQNGRTGHIWGDRYRSMIVEGEPPDETESLRAGAEETEGDGRPLSRVMKAGVITLSRKTRARVRPLPWKPAKIPRKAASPPARPPLKPAF
ncbi:MAG: transposase [Spirochaetaceae bacterium]|jgi:REP element-mobilizing transposase RayT|nr:transposase [Spirochaetaceae bacterium]